MHILIAVEVLLLLAGGQVGIAFGDSIMFAIGLLR